MMPLWTALGSLFMPLGIAFLIFVSKNPEISQKLGLVSAKANLVAYAATDWRTYLGLYRLLIGAGGLHLIRPDHQLGIRSRICRRHLEGHAGRAGSALQHTAGKVHRRGPLVCGARSIIIFVVGLVMGVVHQAPRRLAGRHSPGHALSRSDHSLLPGHSGRSAICALRQHRPRVISCPSAWPF